MTPVDFPWDQVIEDATKLIKMGVIVFQKFTCQHCGARQTMEEPNTFYAEGICEECKGVTNIKEKGMNFRAIISSNPEQLRELIHTATGKVVPRRTDA